MVDYMVWPWLERLEVLKIKRNLKLDEARFPKLNAYIKRMLEQPAVKEVFIPAEIHAKFYDGYLAGQVPDYDLGLLGKA